jgi:hypothetical protein
LNTWQIVRDQRAAVRRTRHVVDRAAVFDNGSSALR